MKILDTTCNFCHGACRVKAKSSSQPGLGWVRVPCPRCKGSGEEPKSSADRIAIGLILLITTIAVYFLYQIK